MQLVGPIQVDFGGQITLRRVSKCNASRKLNDSPVVDSSRPFCKGFHGCLDSSGFFLRVLTVENCSDNSSMLSKVKKS